MSERGDVASKDYSAIAYKQTDLKTRKAKNRPLQHTCGEEMRVAPAKIPLRYEVPNNSEWRQNEVIYNIKCYRQAKTD